MKKLLLATLLIMISFFTPASGADLLASQDGVENIAVTPGGFTRHYLLYTPPGLAANTPLLIAYHPSSSDGAKMRSMSGAALERLANKYGFALAYPNGYARHFNDCRRAASYSARTENIDDIGYTRAIIDDVASRQHIDRQRVYALGYSNGGHMVLRLALQAPDMIAGVIAISANLPTEENNDCKPVDGRPVSVVFIEGTKDKINPYAGGDVTIFGMDSRGPVMSAKDSARWFAERYGIKELADVPAPMTLGKLTASWQDWGNASAKVRLITIDGGGHTVPQSDVEFPQLFVGATFKSDAPLESAWNTINGMPQK